MPKYDEEDDSSFAGRLKSFYYKLEDGYYSILDKLHETGIDLYKYFVEPIESKGIPSFPIAIALLLLITGGVFLAFTGLPSFGPTGKLTVTLSTVAGNIEGIPVTLVIEDKDFATKSIQNSVATFEGVPLNKPAKVKINHPNFNPVLMDVSLANADNTLTISLAAREVPKTDFLVSVVDSTTQQPIRDAVISFQSLSSGLQGTVTTQPDGTAVIALDSPDATLSFNINAENFESTQRTVFATDGQANVQLIPVTGNIPEGGDNPVKGNIVVNVKDDAGNYVAASVEIFEEGSSTPLASDNVESGVARFEGVAPIGTKVYAVVSSQSQEFLTAQTTASELTQEDLELNVELQRATPASSQLLSITITNDVGASIQFASVALFSVNTNQLLTDGITDESGKVSFQLSNSISLDSIYAAVSADGFLPLIASISSKQTTLELLPLAAGNNVEFNAEILTPDGEEAAGARVELADASGRLYGISQFTGMNGIATFTGVPVDVSLRLFAFLEAAVGQSDIFEVSLAESGEKTVSFTLSRPVGRILASVLNLVDGKLVANALVTAYVDSPTGVSVANCTSASDGSCVLEKVWANRDIFLVASADGFEPSTSTAQFVSTKQTKLLNLFILSNDFRGQTIINLVSLTDDKGKEVLDFPAIERGKVYTVRLAASFANNSQRQGVFLRVGEDPATASDPIVVKDFEFTPSDLGKPFAVHSTTYSPGSDCTTDLLNNDINNEGKKWVEVNYEGVTGVVELVARVFVKPTADPASDKLTLHYRAFAVQNGKYSRNPFDDELQLERKTPSKDECYATTIDRSFDLIEGNAVCNDAGTACIGVSFSSQHLQGVGSPFTATINKPFNVNYEVRSFGTVEGSSAFVRISSTADALKFSQFTGTGTASFNDEKTSGKILLGSASDVYTGAISATGFIPTDFIPLTIEFADSRGTIAMHSRSFIVVQGTGALQLTQLTPTEFEVGKAKDLKITVKTSTGQPVGDATISFEEEVGSPFDGDVPVQIAGDNSPANGEEGKYIIKKLKTIAPGTFNVIVSRDGFVPLSESLISKVSNFFEFDQPDFISLTCNSTTLSVTNALDTEVTTDIFVDPACVNVAGPGIAPVGAEGGQEGTTHYRIANFKPGRTRILTLSPNSNASCQLEVSATDPRTGTKSSDDPIQIENTCTTFGSTSFANADGVVYINGNVFQPPRLLIDTFSRYFYGSYQPQNYWDPRFFDSASYSGAPVGGYNAFYQRTGVVDPSTGQPVPQYVDPRFQGAVGVPSGAAYGGGQYEGQYGGGGQYGRAGVPDPYGGGSFFDIRRANFQSNWTIAWVNQDAVPHSFKCFDRNGNTLVQVDSLQPQSTYTQVMNKPGLYKCTLENTNTGIVKIKSMCPKKGALYYTRLVTRCMARKAIGDSGLFDGGKQHSAKVAASVKTRFTVFANKFDVGQTSKDTKVECKGGGEGAECTLKITPLVQANGFGFAIEDKTGKPDYSIRLKPGGTIDPQCFSFDHLDKITSYRALLNPVVSGVAAIGLTTPSQFASFAIKFNEKGNCVKVKPIQQEGRIDFAPAIWHPNSGKLLAGEGFALFELQSGSNPNVRYTIKLVIKPDEFIDGRYLFTTVPTISTNNKNKLFYRTSTSADPREPGFVINNLPSQAVGLLRDVPAGQAKPIVSQPSSIGVLDGNEDTSSEKLTSLSALKNGFFLCTENGACAAEGGQPVKLIPFATESKDVKQVASTLGDVIGNYKFESDSAPVDLPDADKPFACSGVNYCSSATEAGAVDLGQKYIEQKLKEQYSYVETFNLDSSIDNMQDSLATCIQEALAEIVSQEAQYQMCKTLAEFCGGATYLDPEIEEVEEGESFAGGITLDAVLGDSKTILKDIVCQETEAGQNLQALRSCLQPGNRACRDLIVSRIAKNLKQTQVQSVAQEVEIVSLQRPVISFVTKRIQDDARLAEASISEKLSLGGYNVYQFSPDPKKLIAAQEGQVIFEVRPPGFDFSKIIAGASSGLATAGFAPFRLPGQVYDWATSKAASPDGKVREVTLGFPYVATEGSGANLKTRVEFDRFAPTLLTLNKYPLMRAIDSRRREAKTVKSDSDLKSNNCTVENRPVDPLQLFDACEELRGEKEQEKYDKESTDKKSPFSRSLVFQAVPQTLRDASKPTWPLEYSKSFEVAIPPKYVFSTTGETTGGISPPAIASVPIIGRALYPEASASNKFKKLEIPASDIKRYAVQVTSCKYTRDPTNNEIILDKSVENNCNSLQWPASLLFPSSGNGELVLDINGEKKCDGKQACVGLQLVGNHLAVAVVDGLSGAVGVSPSSLLSTQSGSVSLTEVSQDLLRYYADESYVPSKLMAVLANTANKCELLASQYAVLLKCGESKQDASTPHQVNLEIKGKFVQPATTGSDVVFKISGIDSSVKFKPGEVPVALIFSKTEKVKCFATTATACRAFNAPIDSFVNTTVASNAFTVTAGSDAYVVFATLGSTHGEVSKIVGLKKSGTSIERDFEISAGSVKLTAGKSTKVTNVVKQFFADIAPSNAVASEEKVNDVDAGNETTFVDPGLVGLSFLTIPAKSEGKTAAVSIALAPNKYYFTYKFGDVISKQVENKLKEINDKMTSPQRELKIKQLISEAMAVAVKTTCATSDKFYSIDSSYLSGAHVSFSSKAGEIKVTPPKDVSLSFYFPLPVNKCTAMFNLPSVGEFKVDASPANEKIDLDFTKASVIKAAPLPTGGCTGTATPLFDSVASNVFYRVKIAGLTSEQLKDANASIKPPWAQNIERNPQVYSGNFELSNVPQNQLETPATIFFTVKSKNGNVLCTGEAIPTALDVYTPITRSSNRIAFDKGGNYIHKIVVYDKGAVSAYEGVYEVPPADLPAYVLTADVTNKLLGKVAFLVGDGDVVFGRANIPSEIKQLGTTSSCNVINPSFYVPTNANQLSFQITLSSSSQFPPGGELRLLREGVALPVIVSTSSSGAGVIIATSAAVQPNDAGVKATIAQSGKTFCSVEVDTKVSSCTDNLFRGVNLRTNAPPDDFKFFIPGKGVFEITFDGSIVPSTSTPSGPSYLINKADNTVDCEFPPVTP